MIGLATNKNVEGMKRILVLLACLLCAVSLHAQSQRMWVSLEADSASLVRNWTDHYVVYGQKEDGRGYFALVDKGSNMVYYADSIGTYRVTDFVVDADSVFFVGVFPDGGGVVGHFDINGLFFSGQPVSFSTPDPLSLALGLEAQSSMGFFRDFDHIVTFNDRDGVRHMVFVGSLRTSTRYTEFHSVVDTTRYLFDWTPRSAILKAASRFRENEWFDDVMLDGDVVVVGGRMKPVEDSLVRLMYRFLPCRNFSLNIPSRFEHKYGFHAQPMVLQKAGAADVSFFSVFRSKDAAGNTIVHSLGYEGVYNNQLVCFRRSHKQIAPDSSFVKGTAFVTGNSTLCVLLGAGVDNAPYPGADPAQKQAEYDAAVNGSSADLSRPRTKMSPEEAPLVSSQYSVTNKEKSPTVSHTKYVVQCSGK